MKKFLHTPDGMTDIIFSDYERYEQIKNKIEDVFQSHKGRRVETPVIEYAEMYGYANTAQYDTMFRIFDNDGRVLALRPDITTSVARIATSPAIHLPLRLYYIGKSFRNDDNFSRLKMREFTQAGIELLDNDENAPRVLADAEVIRIAVEALLAAGLVDFRIELGHSGFLNGLMRQAGFNAVDCESFKKTLKDYTALIAFANERNVPSEVKEILVALPEMFGGFEIIENMLSNPVINDESRDGLRNLSEIYNSLSDVAEYITFNLGMIPDFQYYSGVMIKGLTYGMGFSVVSGGRYDRLTEHFGRKISATGISLSIERIMEASVRADNEYITVALAKGRLAKLSSELFEELGFDCKELTSNTRKLIFTDEVNKMKFILVKAGDVPTYVEYGVADIGISGKDTILEERKNIYEVIDIGFGACKMAVAGFAGGLNSCGSIRVASKYPSVARDYFHNVKGQTADIIKLNGSVELAPIVGLSDVIVDIVESGKTLEENGLVVLEDICDITARLIVNRVSMKMKSEKILKIIHGLREAVKK